MIDEQLARVYADPIGDAFDGHRQTDPDGTENTRGFRVVKGGGTFVLPVVEKIDILSLELLTYIT